MAPKQAKWLINGITHCFHSVLIKGAAILDCKLGEFQVPLTARPEILSPGCVSCDVESHELRKFRLQGVIEPTTTILMTKIGVQVSTLSCPNAP